MRRIPALLLVALLAPAAAGLDAASLFLPGEGPEGYAVVCGDRKYDVYVVRSGGSISAAVVLADGRAVEDPAEYNAVLQTLWYYLQLTSFADLISFYSPDTATSLQSLANSLQNKEYDLALAAKRLRDLNLLEYADDVEQLDTERVYALSEVRSLAWDLSESSRALLKFLKNPYCGFALDVSLYERFEEAYRLLNGYDRHSRHLMSALAHLDADAETAAALSIIIRYLAPPFSMVELDSLRARVSTEKELAQQIRPLDNVEKLFEDAKRRVLRAEYLSFVSAQVSTAGNLEQTVQYILSTWPEESEERRDLETAYRQMKEFERRGDYEKALKKARAVKNLAVRMLRRGFPEQEVPWYAYAVVVVILLAVVYILVRRGKGESGEDTYLDYP